MHFMMALAYDLILLLFLYSIKIYLIGATVLHDTAWFILLCVNKVVSDCMERFIFDVCFAWMVFRLEFPSAWISTEWEQSVWTLAMWAECFAELCLPKPQTRVLPSLWVSSEMSLCSPLLGISAAGDNWAFTLYETSKEIETLWMICCRGLACVPPKDVEVLTPSFSECNLNWR